MRKRPLGKKRSEESFVEEVTILCKIWYEDGVWNSSARDLPVAAFGKNTEQARKNLTEAVLCHFDALQELGQLRATIQKYNSSAK